MRHTSQNCSGTNILLTTTAGSTYIYEVFCNSCVILMLDTSRNPPYAQNREGIIESSVDGWFEVQLVTNTGAKTSLVK